MNKIDQLLADIARHIDEATVLALDAQAVADVTPKQAIALKALQHHLVLARAAQIHADMSLTPSEAAYPEQAHAARPLSFGLRRVAGRK